MDVQYCASASGLNDFPSSDDDATKAPPDAQPDFAIYREDPEKWMRFVDRRVAITVRVGKAGAKGKTGAVKSGVVVKTGVVFTIDPVSESVVLGEIEDGSLWVEIIASRAVEHMEMLGQAEPETLDRLRRTLTPSTAPVLTPAQLTLRRDAVLDWLKQNRLPVDLEGDKIRVAGDALVVEPPYDVDACHSFNAIVLKKSLNPWEIGRVSRSHRRFRSLVGRQKAPLRLLTFAINELLTLTVGSDLT